MPRFALAHDADSGALAAVLDAVEAAAQASGLRRGTVDRVVLVAGELLSNAVEHGSGDVAVWWQDTPTGGRLVVSGGGQPGADRVNAATHPDTLSTRGRGLAIVRELADEITSERGSISASFSARPTD